MKKTIIYMCALLSLVVVGCAPADNSNSKLSYEPEPTISASSDTEWSKDLKEVMNTNLGEEIPFIYLLFGYEWSEENDVITIKGKNINMTAHYDELLGADDSGYTFVDTTSSTSEGDGYLRYKYTKSGALGTITIEFEYVSPTSGWVGFVIKTYNVI